MSNVLNEEKKQQVIALGKLGWTLRRIEQATGVRRETAGAYLKAAGVAVRPAGGWGPRSAKPANGVITDPADSKPANEAGVTTDLSGPRRISENGRALAKVLVAFARPMEKRSLARDFFLFLFGAGPGKSAIHADVAFMAGVFEHTALALRHGDLDRPGSVPGRGIFDGELIKKRVGVETAEAFRQLQVLAASTERILV